ncbi:MAG TPA: hypothetical protein VK502_03815 [Candidatus Saccharimonadales bacterium]|nr:hypothetical protein [Candidatus Saccharimonadales bacterium]
MNNILYIGGVASNPRQVSGVVDALSVQYGTCVKGMSFSEAQKNRALVARLAQDCTVITHSAGMLMLAYCTPKEIIAIAPPMVASVPLLIGRGILKTFTLFRSGRESRERRRKIIAYHIGTMGEYLIRPFYISGQMTSIGIFNAAKEAVAMAANGSKVTLCFMQDEHLFSLSSSHPDVAVAKQFGVTVYDDIIGHHDDFLLFPLDVLGQIDQRE